MKTKIQKRQKKAVDSQGKVPKQVSEWYSNMAREGHRKARKQDPEAYANRQAAAGAASRGKGLGVRGVYDRAAYGIKKKR